MKKKLSLDLRLLERERVSAAAATHGSTALNNVCVTPKKPFRNFRCEIYRNIGVNGVFPARGVDEFAGQLVDGGRDDLKSRMVSREG